MQMMVGRLAAVGCALVLLAGCGGGGGGSSTDTNSPSDVPVTDTGSTDMGQATDLNCIPQCDGRECGDNGCGGSCGECSGAKPHCSGGVCVIECATESQVVHGWVKNNVNDMDFTGEPVDVQIFHKLDIDEWEDGCISKYDIAMSKLGLGCEFNIQMETDVNGHFGVTEAILMADSFCPNWSDADEGEYHLSDSSMVMCSDVEVTDYMVESTCIPGVSLGFSGLLTLKRISDGKVLEVDLSELQIVGDMISTGDTELVCPDLCVGKECGDDGCGGNCGSCPFGEACVLGKCKECTADCAGKVCGDDGCGGNCGACPVGEVCVLGKCKGCTPDCAGKECGDDGCGGNCGSCPQSKPLCLAGQCKAAPLDGDCPEIASCSILCDTPTCKDQCLTNASDEVKTMVSTIEGCLNALNCGPLVGLGGFKGCALDACSDQIAACYQGSGECNDIRKCRIDCPTSAGDYSCALMCFAEGSKEAQDLFQKYADCIFGKEVKCSETDIKANGWPLNDCEKFAQGQYCPLQTQACIPPS